MPILNEIFTKLTWIVSVLTDWLLILAGMVLALLAWWRVDVAEARYPLICAGILLSIFGFWFRYRRLKNQMNKIDTDQREP